MFREMRRKKQELSIEECKKILDRNTSGVLAVFGDEGYPYTVPMSYVFDGKAIYFHSAKQGHKLDAIRSYNKASFCVIDQDQVIPEKYTTYFRSVVVFGWISIVTEEEEKQNSLSMLSKKYSPNDEEGRLKEIDQLIAHTEMIRLELEHMSGKEAKELVAMKQA